MKFFIDENIPYLLADILNSLDVNASSSKQEDLMGVDDTIIFDYLKKHNFDVIVTRDTRIPTKPNERQALINNGLTGFFLNKSWQKQKPNRIELCCDIAALLPRFMEIFENQSTPSLYKVKYFTLKGRKKLIERIV